MALCRSERRLAVAFGRPIATVALGVLATLRMPRPEDHDEQH